MRVAKGKRVRASLVLISMTMLLSQIAALILSPPVYAVSRKVENISIADEKRMKAFLYLDAMYDCLSGMKDSDLPSSLLANNSNLSALFDTGSMSTKDVKVGKYLAEQTEAMGGRNLWGHSIYCKDAAWGYSRMATGADRIDHQIFESGYLLDGVYSVDTSSDTKAIQCQYRIGNDSSNGPLTTDDNNYYGWPQGYFSVTGILLSDVNAINMVSPITIYYNNTGVVSVGYPQTNFKVTWSTWPTETVYKMFTLSEEQIKDSISSRFSKSGSAFTDEELKSGCYNVVTKNTKFLRGAAPTNMGPGMEELMPVENFQSKYHVNYNNGSGWGKYKAHMSGDDYRIKKIDVSSTSTSDTYLINTSTSNNKKAVGQIQSNILTHYLGGASSVADYLSTSNGAILKYQIYGRYMFNGDGGFANGCNGISLSKEDAARVTDSNNTYNSGQPSTADVKAYIVDETAKQDFVTHFGKEGKVAQVKYDTALGSSGTEKDCKVLASDFNALSFSIYSTAGKDAITAVQTYMGVVSLPDDYDGHTPPDSVGDYEDGPGDCNVGQLGWIVCPVSRESAEFVDAIYISIVDDLVQVPASGIFKTDGGTYQAWEVFRNIANVVFVIMLLIVLVSQITGIGISNYGIKKLLPKLIICVLLINLSYIICQLAVDISNIVGHQVNNLLAEINQRVVDGSTYDPAQFTFSAVLALVLSVGGVSIGVITIVSAAASGGVWALLGPLLLALLSAVIAVLFFFAVLGVRQMLIVLLIALSPIAFACYLLPGMDNILKKWWNLFKGLLIVYPICGLLVGGGRLASAIIFSTVDSGTSEVLKFALLVIGMTVKVLPFILLPTLIKGSLALAGNIGAKISSLGKGVGGWATKKTSVATGLDERIADGNRQRVIGRAKRRSKGLEDAVKGGTASARQRRMYSRYQGIASAETNENQKAWSAAYNGMSPEDIVSSVNLDDEASVKAGVETLAKMGKDDQLMELANKVTTDKQKASLQKSLLENGVRGSNYALHSWAKKGGAASSFASHLSSGQAMENATQQDWNGMSHDLADKLGNTAGALTTTDGDKLAGVMAGGSADARVTGHLGAAIAGNSTLGQSVVQNMSSEQLARVDDTPYGQLVSSVSGTGLEGSLRDMSASALANNNDTLASGVRQSMASNVMVGKTADASGSYDTGVLSESGYGNVRIDGTGKIVEGEIANAPKVEDSVVYISGSGAEVTAHRRDDGVWVNDSGHEIDTTGYTPK